MPQTTVCRWLPQDPAAIETFVSSLLVRSRIIHGRHPRTRARFAEVGENLETATSRVGLEFDVGCLRQHYRITIGQAQVYTVRTLDPIVQEFQDYIEREGVVYAAFNEMFEQAPPPQNEDQAKVCCLGIRGCTAINLDLDRRLCGLDGNDRYELDDRTQFR